MTIASMVVWWSTYILLSLCATIAQKKSSNIICFIKVSKFELPRIGMVYIFRTGMNSTFTWAMPNIINFGASHNVKFVLQTNLPRI